MPSASARSLLLKGADTIVATADGRTIVCDVGPPSLATAGTGDVLTGIVGAFLAKGLDPVDAAAAAAIAHGLAARAVPHQAGLVASDVGRRVAVGARLSLAREWCRDALACPDRPRRDPPQRTRPAAT